MRFGIRTLDEVTLKGKTVLCRVDINQPVDRDTGTLKSINRIRACVPTVRELSDKGARVVLLAHQGSDIEYKNFYTTRPHAAVLAGLLGREVQWIDDVCGPAAREKIRALQDGEILLGKEVAQILSTMTDDMEVITAGILHDVVEDTDGTLDEIERRFGERVAALVASESEEKFPGEAISIKAVRI